MNFLNSFKASAFGAMGVLALAAMPALAEIAAPTGEVILTIDGAITETNTDGAAQFDLDMIKALPATTFTTTTTWTTGEQEFTGVPLKALLESVGGVGATITATALNNYAIDIPAESLEDGAPIVAYLINGETFSRRDKGPLWIVYPYDSDAQYQTELVYGWSIWQLSNLTVKE